MASVMQVIFSIPEYDKRYANRATEIFKAAPRDPTNDFFTQMAKLGSGLLSGRYSESPKTEDSEKTQLGIAPRMFKTLIGKGHQVFSTNHQQDALEFFQHLLTLTTRQEKSKDGGKFDPSKIFEFKVEEKIQDTTSGHVKYTTKTDNTISLPIPISAAVNKNEVEAFKLLSQERKAKGEKIKPNEIVRPTVPLSACFAAYAEPEELSFFSPVSKTKGIALKTTRFASFPEVLVLHMRKFDFDGWIPKKLDVNVDVPDNLEIEHLRGKGLQPGEKELSQDRVPEAPLFNESIVAQLMDMGFPRIRCEKAAIATKNSGIEQASGWLFEHMEDIDIDTPLPTKSTNSTSSSSGVPEEAILMLIDMGFSRAKSIKALKATDNNPERAVEWAFSHTEEDDSPMEVETPITHSDAKGRYELFAFISHIGQNTGSGHYVCHIKKHGKWIFYNDSKVAESADPPRQLAYIYFYKRC